MPPANTTSVTNLQGTNVVIIRTTAIHSVRFGYGWLLLALLAAALISIGLRKILWTNTSN